MLYFRLTPPELRSIILSGIPNPKATFCKECTNMVHQLIIIDDMIDDIIVSYTYLYENYIGFHVGGTMSLKNISSSLQYSEFVSKMFWMYTAIVETFSPRTALPWITRLKANYTLEEIRLLAKNCIDMRLAQHLTLRTILSPLSWPSKAGQVNTSFARGLRVIDEVANLMNTFHANNITVFIVASSVRALPSLDLLYPF
jgi:hypothetical protein